MAAGLPKEEIQMKRIPAFIIVLAALLVVGLAGAAQARELARAELKVRIEIPVMQRLTVLEPTDISSSTQRMDKPLEFRNVGRIRVQSNADWALTVGAVTDGNVQVAVRPAGDKKLPSGSMSTEPAGYLQADTVPRISAGMSGSKVIGWGMPTPRISRVWCRLYFTLGRL